MNTKIVAGALTLFATALAGVAIASSNDSKQIVEFYKGHTHDGGLTQDAPEHGGGLDANGCHNKSVPYHCHR
jgi:hypothetical protein